MRLKQFQLHSGEICPPLYTYRLTGLRVRSMGHQEAELQLSNADHSRKNAGRHSVPETHLGTMVYPALHSKGAVGLRRSSQHGVALAFGLLRARGTALLNTNHIDRAIVKLLFKNGYLTTHAHATHVGIGAGELARVQNQNVGART
eukprot:9155977-Pyramimonas_sp.AAC.2